MTQTDALKALAKKVELGQFRPHFEGPEHTIWPGMDDGNSLKRHHLRYAYYGDLNAAKALHDALLPDEGFEIFRTGKYPGMIPGSSPYAYGARVGYGTTYRGDSDNTARAWLLAILRAEIAKEKKNE